MRVVGEKRGLVAQILCFFFFQAEDGIRDLTVTGVQTCALPILPANQAEYILRDAVAVAVVCSTAAQVAKVRAVRGALPGLRHVIVFDTGAAAEIGRASCRERGEISGGAGSLKKKKNKI